MFDVMDIIKTAGQCGSHEGTCGIADALNNVCSLVKEVRREATKVCILTCFLGKRSADLEYYRCYHGYDAIKLCSTLAEHAISLYIIGVNLERPDRNQTEENYFLSGISAICGGRYFEIQAVGHISTIIEFILKETSSIEGAMGTVNDITIDEINKQYGDVNDIHLTRHLKHQLDQRSCKVNRIQQNRAALIPITKISERVSWADDLDDAIEGVKNMKMRRDAATRRRSRSLMTVSVEQSSNVGPDLEISSRMRKLCMINTIRYLLDHSTLSIVINSLVFSKLFYMSQSVLTYAVGVNGECLGSGSVGGGLTSLQADCTILA
ncbi:hypothetical protein QZH41_006806 [Actinostola sp. cb2023]|nr:hypothetical protein QZH41_006806 [Actinostola sp. cb2023]